jgi:dual specificity tyrosine-phosphorylation-regulated kinase 2/3/4
MQHQVQDLRTTRPRKRKAYGTLHDGGTVLTDDSSKENYDPGTGSSRSRIASGREPTLNASTQNNHSLFSFGTHTAREDFQASSGPHDFLPSVSFDDLHSSIATASNDLQLSQFPAPNGQGSVIPHTSFGDIGCGDGRTAQGGRGAFAQQPQRSGSILRRQSTSARQSSISSTTSAASGTVEPPTAPMAMRTRRQSQYPPISSTNSSKAPRKSIGPGVIDSDFTTKASQRRRPSIASSTSTQTLSNVGGFGRTSIGGSGNPATEGARLATARAAKAKSLQPPARQGPAHLSTPTMTPEHARTSSFARSPGRPSGRGTSTPSSSARRMSIMPGMPTAASHATGLGARTVSPTDARRAKRLSTFQAPPVPNNPSTPQPDHVPAGRASSRSPSMLPRKTSTPSSSRTTPDINRKSYSSGLSIGSNGSYNTARTSTGSLQPRLPPNISNSRLPTAKPRNVHSSAGNDDEEVPPVPAIPKAYESPKDSPSEQPFFNKRKSSLPLDSSDRNSSSANELSGTAFVREPPKVEIEQRTRRKFAIGSGSDVDQKGNATPTKKKNLQPLRLPPLNLLPLSTPTAAKIAALHEPAFSDGNLTPPHRRVDTKTPTTPLTASKASFFSRNRQADTAEQSQDYIRSSSSAHHVRTDSSTIRDVNNGGFTMPVTASNRPRQAVSPFVSSSLPKSSGEYAFIPRSTTSGEFNAVENGNERPPRLTGPRAQKVVKPLKSSSPTQLSSPDEPTTPSSTSSLRRKLSLGWKRTTSKNSISLSHAANERDSEYPPQPPKHDNMPPPRLPASATMNILSTATVPSPSPSIKSTTYLDSKRRKSSVSSLSMFSGHDRTRSDSWGINRSPKKEKDASFDGGAERPKLVTSRTSSSVLSPVHKMLNSKNSTNTLKPQDPWTADLDKDDLSAEEEMKKLASKRKETEQAARQLDALRKRATPKERVSPHQAIQVANLNIFERGEIVDYKDIYFCGTQNAAKHVGGLHSEAANFGYDDERGDYTIVLGDHLCYRYEIIDILGKGSFGQVVRCIDHKTGVLVAVKIIRNKKRFHQQALVEVNILQKLRDWVSFVTCLTDRLLIVILGSQKQTQHG